MYEKLDIFEEKETRQFLSIIRVNIKYNQIFFGVLLANCRKFIGIKETFNPYEFSTITQKYSRKHLIIEDIHIFLLKIYSK